MWLLWARERHMFLIVPARNLHGVSPAQKGDWMRYEQIIRRNTVTIEETRLIVQAGNLPNAIAKIQAILERNGADWRRISQKLEYDWQPEPTITEET